MVALLSANEKAVSTAGAGGHQDVIECLPWSLGPEGSDGRGPLPEPRCAAWTRRRPSPDRRGTGCAVDRRLLRAAQFLQVEGSSEPGESQLASRVHLARRPAAGEFDSQDQDPAISFYRGQSLPNSALRGVAARRHLLRCLVTEHLLEERRSCGRQLPGFDDFGPALDRCKRTAASGSSRWFGDDPRELSAPSATTISAHVSHVRSDSSFLPVNLAPTRGPSPSSPPTGITDRAESAHPRDVRHNVVELLRRPVDHDRARLAQRFHTLSRAGEAGYVTPCDEVGREGLRSQSLSRHDRRSAYRQLGRRLTTGVERRRVGSRNAAVGHVLCPRRTRPVSALVSACRVDEPAGGDPSEADLAG
jgi:hypothetical protein